MAGFLGFPATPFLAPASGVGQPIAGWDTPTGVVREFEQPLWSTWQYAHGAVLANRTDRIYQNANGQIGQGFATALTLPETNMVVGGQLPGGLAYDVFAVALDPYYIDCFGVTRADLLNIQHNLVPAWYFLQTSIDISPALLVGAGGGVFGSTADTGAAEGVGGSRIALNHGAGQVWVYRSMPILLPAKTTFGIDYKWGAYAIVEDGGTSSAAMNLRTILIGKSRTAVGQG